MLKASRSVVRSVNFEPSFAVNSWAIASGLAGAFGLWISAATMAPIIACVGLGAALGLDFETGAKLSGANLKEANLVGAILDNADTMLQVLDRPVKKVTATPPPGLPGLDARTPERHPRPSITCSFAKTV